MFRIKFIKNFLKGFTLIELMVVIAVIGLLASIVLVEVNSARDKARYINILSTMKQIETAANLFYDTYDRWPQDAYPDCQDVPGYECELISEKLLPVWPKPVCGGDWSYDWENWPLAGAGLIIRITLRNTQQGNTGVNSKFYHCITATNGDCNNHPNGGGRDILDPTLNKITCKE